MSDKNKAYKKVQSDLQKLEKFAKDYIEAYLPEVKVEEFETYDYKNKKLTGIFKAANKKRYHFEIIDNKDEPIVREIIK